MKRVLLIARSTLFSRGVENLLRQTPKLEVWRCEADEGKVIERIESLQPDVVLIEHCKSATQPEHALRRMLRAYTQLRVIELDPQDETIWIYSSQQRVCQQVQDLVAVIRNSTSH